MKEMFLLVILSCTIIGSMAVNRCDRTPDRPLKPKNTEEIDKYIIEISGDPSSYIAGDTYTVILRYNPSMEGIHMFKDFMLTVEKENIQIESDEIQRVGYFNLTTNDKLSTFSRKCENTILQTNSVPKSSIQVYWIAPPTGSGCIAFRATVVETRENWFSDDGSLTKVLCEELSENENVQPPILDECCACEEAKYELVFEGLWTRNTHPKDYPSNIWYTKFGDIVGASHANDESFWQYESYASENLRALGENGDTSGVETELKEKMGKTVRTIIKANGLRYPNITGKTFTFFRVDSKHHLVSFVTKIIPSPDWILGVSSFELCLKDCSWVEQRILNLYPWDIGTNDGISYNSMNEPATESKKIDRIKTDNPESPFYNPEEKDMKPFAKIYLNRLKIYQQICESPETTVPSDVTTEEGVGGECETTPWSEWTSCSEKCGEGFIFRKRRLLNPANEDICTEKLVEHDKCFGKRCKNQHNSNLLSAEDPKCELDNWGEWSSCSVSCGKGTFTRDRKFLHPEFAAQCENNDPTILQQNEECKDEGTDCPTDNHKEAECSDNWSPWSPCNVTCGTGIKTRLRLPDRGDNINEDTESECSNIEEVKCYEPLCGGEDSTGSSYGDIPSLNQVTTDIIFSQPFGPVANCKVSEWSVWGPCELNEGKCGKGYKTQHRQILQHAMNGGKACPRKLMRKKGCIIPCHQEKPHYYSTSTTMEETIGTNFSEPTETTTEESIDCIMKPWSSWSPCSHSCGGSAVQQRTRSIERPARKNGKPCGPRLQQRDCPLPIACSDKGVPIM
ncbi:hypothetical protein HHI36_011123 [Cryptolaemus montrouzieri]|uniref:Spondin-1 n=1 Tax=Cryptolaemus montrouzieri TaxID=559131 RepID=A0ABD2ML52_9CUCU